MEKDGKSCTPSIYNGIALDMLAGYSVLIISMQVPSNGDGASNRNFCLIPILLGGLHKWEREEEL